MRTVTGALPAIVRLGIVQGGERNLRQRMLGGVALGIPLRLAADEEGDLPEFFLGLEGPYGRSRQSAVGSRRGVDSASGALDTRLAVDCQLTDDRRLPAAIFRQVT